MMNKRIKIIVATHKVVDAIDKKIDNAYQKIMVGAYNKDVPEGYLSDHFKGGISHKNPNFCELTGQYYLYKMDDSDIKGLVHYRRIFSNNLLPFIRFKAINRKQILKYLKNYDIILPKHISLAPETVEENYANNHHKKDYELLREVFKDKFSDYLVAFEKVSCGYNTYLANMLIAPKEIFDAYSKWLFDVLFELEKRTDISSYDTYQARIYGFLSERLLLVWLTKHPLKVKEVTVLNTEQKQFPVFMDKIKRKLKGWFRK